jgi:nicotinamidase/pyrazinamidase
VVQTVKDALARGYAVVLLADAIRAVNVAPEDGRRAEEEMLRLGAVAARTR